MHLKNIDPLIHLIPGDNHISRNLNLQGVYQSGYTTIISFSTEIDTIRYKGNEYIGNTIDVSASKISDSTNVLAAIYIFSEKQAFSKRIQTQNLLLETYWDRNQVLFESNIEQDQNNNKLQLIGSVDFLQDTTEIKFDSSRMVVLDNVWHFDYGNTIRFTNQEIAFNKFRLSSGNRSISTSGFVSKDPTKEVILEIQDFDMEFLNPVIQQELGGELNGFLRVRDLYGQPIVENELTIDDFTVDDFLVGTIFGKTGWRNKDQSLKVKAFVNRDGIQTINVNGYYRPDITSDPLDLRASFDRTQLNLLEPFLGSFFTNIQGEASGVFTITGKPLDPIVMGDGQIHNGSLKVDYLNTTYRFAGSIGFNQYNIIFRNLDLLDVGNNKGTLAGKISHNGFKNMVLELQGDIENFQVLNTSSKDNSLFYGTGFATGNISFIGPTKNLTINALATTNKGTRIFIPLEGTGTIEQEDYISFVKFSDTTNVSKIEEEELNLGNVKLNFDLDITPDAYCELIFDIKSGDIIRGRGNGRINMQIDTQGEFNMFGDFDITQGGYNFTLYNIINKEFDIKPGSKISWLGDPYEGILDINATYRQITSLAPLVSDTSFQYTSEGNRGYPVDLGLLINGPLSSPNIDFNIDVTDYPVKAIDTGNGNIYLEDVITNFKNRIRTDEHELNRQVFSLLVLRRFSEPESFISTQGSIGSSVSEFISNQLSYWVSQVDENLEIDVDLGSLDQDAFNTFQLRLAYSFLDGRLRVSREGGFSNNTETTQGEIAGIVGDWTVEYLLTQDGKLRAKMYNRTNYNSINNTLGNGSSTSAGVSLLYSQNFNQLSEFWKKERKKRESNDNKKSQPEAVNRNDEEL